MRLDHLLSRVKKTYQKGEAEGFRERGKGNRKHYMVLKVLEHFQREEPARDAGETAWGCSSVGRAPALQAGGQRFEPAHLHQPRKGSDGLIAQLVRARA